MSWNPYSRLRRLLPGAPLEAGQVIGTDAAGAVVQLPTGALIHARGGAQIGDHVYVRDGVIEGPAPALTGSDQEI